MIFFVFCFFGGMLFCSLPFFSLACPCVCGSVVVVVVVLLLFLVVFWCVRIYRR